MPEYRRKTFRDARKRLARRGTKSIRKLPKPKGMIIYRNPNATPVSKIIGEIGARAPFSIENVEWISRKEFIAVGGYGTIFEGRIKFRGKATSERCVIKKFLQRAPQNCMEVVQRLNASRAAHQKIAYLESNGGAFLVQEGFLYSSRVGVISKLERRHGFGMFERMNLKDNPNDVEIFKQCIEQAAHLANAGLKIEKAETPHGEKFIDVFNILKLKSGRRKVIVQDTDLLYPENDRRKAWEVSVRNILEIVGSNFDFNRPIATQIIANSAIANQIIREVGIEKGFI